jgi:uncharacterized protein YggT (Ycf19 family)
MLDAQGAFWLYQLPNLAIAAMMYTLIGRFLMSLVFPPYSDKVIWRVFCQITDPVLNTFRLITPAVVHERILYLFVFIWLFVFRILLYIVMRMYGLAPSIAG